MKTQIEKKRMYKKAHALLLRAQDLLIAARKKHETRTGTRKAA